MLASFNLWQGQHMIVSGTHEYCIATDYYYEGESNENLKYFFKYYLLCRSGTKLYHFSTYLPHAQCKSSSTYKVHKFL